MCSHWITPGHEESVGGGVGVGRRGSGARCYREPGVREGGDACSHVYHVLTSSRADWRLVVEVAALRRGVSGASRL